MEPIEIQPYVFDEHGNVKLSESFQTRPYEYIAILVEKTSRSAMVMLRNEENSDSIPATFLQEKDIAHTIVALQQALRTLRNLPV